MLYGWVEDDYAERIDNTDGDGFKDGDYYFGGEDDGAMTTGWLQIDITYDEAINDDYKYTLLHSTMMRIRAVGSTSSPMVRRLKADDGDRTKDKTINGKKYAFDQYGAMVAEWSLDSDREGSF